MLEELICQEPVTDKSDRTTLGLLATEFNEELFNIPPDGLIDDVAIETKLIPRAGKS